MKNRYGLDARYFKEKLMAVVEGLDNYRPEELARELSRLAMTSDSDEVVKEVERSTRCICL